MIVPAELTDPRRVGLVANPFKNVLETVGTARVVAVTFVNVALVPVMPCKLVLPSTVNVLVTVELAPINPPSKYSSFVVVAPLLEICCKVDVVAALPGQFTPFDKHTLNPFTRTAPAFSVVPLAVANPSHDVDVPFVKDKFVIVPFVPNKFVVVTLVPVPFVNVKFESVVLPTTANVLVTVELAAKNPPKKYKRFVVDAPLFVIC